jgi:hypothetical protein
MEHRTTISTSTSTRYATLPSDYLQARKLKIDRSASNLSDVVLTYSAPMALSVIDSEGMPTHYTVTSAIELDRVSDQVYTLELQYFRSLTALSNSNTTNAVLTRFPMLYLYGSLFHFGQWALDDVMVNKYSTLFAAAIDAANNADHKGRYGPAPGIRIQGSTP